MLEILSIMTATVAVFLIGITIGYRLRNSEKPVELPKKQNIPFTRDYKEQKKQDKQVKEFLKEINKTAEYIENF